MTRKETISLVQYLYFMEERLEAAVKDCNYRAVRRDLDSLDLLEEIIAKERLRLFQDVSSDILTILNQIIKLTMKGIIDTITKEYMKGGSVSFV